MMDQQQVQPVNTILTSLDVLSVLQCLTMSLVDKPLSMYPDLFMDHCLSHRHGVELKT